MDCNKLRILYQVIILLGYGPDGPPRKLFLQRQGKNGDNPSTEVCDQQHRLLNQTNLPVIFSWRPVMHFILWASAWSAYVLVLCDISLQQYGGLAEMFKRYVFQYYVLLQIQSALGYAEH